MRAGNRKKVRHDRELPRLKTATKLVDRNTAAELVGDVEIFAVCSPVKIQRCLIGLADDALKCADLFDSFVMLHGHGTVLIDNGSASLRIEIRIKKPLQIAVDHAYDLAKKARGK